MLIALGLTHLCLIMLYLFCPVFKDGEIVNISISFLYRSQTGSLEFLILIPGTPDTSQEHSSPQRFF